MAETRRHLPVVPDETLGLADVTAWFREQGCSLDIYQARDGVYRAAYSVTGLVRIFGEGETPLRAARQARAIFIARESVGWVFGEGPGADA